MLYARWSFNYLVSIGLLRRARFWQPTPWSGWARSPEPGELLGAHLDNARKTGLMRYLRMSKFIHRNTDGPHDPSRRSTTYGASGVTPVFRCPAHREALPARPAAASSRTGQRKINGLASVGAFDTACWLTELFATRSTCDSKNGTPSPESPARTALTSPNYSWRRVTPSSGIVGVLYVHHLSHRPSLQGYHAIRKPGCSCTTAISRTAAGSPVSSSAYSPTRCTTWPPSRMCASPSTSPCSPGTRPRWAPRDCWRPLGKTGLPCRLPGVQFRDVRRVASAAARRDPVPSALPVRSGEGLRVLDHARLPVRHRALRGQRHPLQPRVAASGAHVRHPQGDRRRPESKPGSRTTCTSATWMRAVTGDTRRVVEAMWLMLQQDSPDDYVITGTSYSVRDFVEHC